MRFVWLSLAALISFSLSTGTCWAVSPDVQNPEMLENLTGAQQQALAENGFVVVPDQVPQIYSIYKSAADRGLPIFVTTDSVLHTFHVLYDYALRQAEYDFFVPSLDHLMQAMLDTSLALARTSTGNVQQAALDNLAFFSVAQQLLTPDSAVPAEVRDKVQAEIDLIMSHAAIAESPIFGVEEDYSQYVPRGHYTRNETFERYFRSMMWLGRMPFLLMPGDGPEDMEMGRHQTRQAILIVDSLRKTAVGDEEAWDVWERIYLPTAFFVGTTDDLNVYDYDRLVEKIYGDDFTPVDLQDDQRLDLFMAEALLLSPPRIVSTPVDDREDAAVATKGFRFMGQRFVFDSYIFQQLVYDKVTAYLGTGQPFTAVPSPAGFIRGLPRGLDVASVFGSARALAIMREDGDAEYEGYEEQVTALQHEMDTLPAEQWSENLYWGWLYSLRPLLQEKDPEYPVFMQMPAWTDKDLHSFLGSWTELRHDTILYAKQSMTIRATSLQREPLRPVGYVEPQPEVYARLANLCEQMKDGLEKMGVLSVEAGTKLEQFGAVLESLRSISLKELGGEGLTEEEAFLIQRFGHIMEGLTTFSAVAEGNVSSEADERMAIVTDVHTDTNSGKVLQEAVGDAFRIFVVVPAEAGTLVHLGGVFSYFEFKQPMGDRLTDEAWQAMEPKPAQPGWTESFIVE